MTESSHTPDETTDAIPGTANPGTSGGPVVESGAESTPEHVAHDCAKAPLNPRWSIKLFIIAFFVIGFGGLGLYDATIKYPERGQRYADWAKWQYLEAGKAAGSEEFGVFERQMSVTDPVAEYTRLNDPETRRRNEADAQSQTSSSHLRATMRTTRLEWLKSLKTIGELKPENTMIEVPSDELAELKARWTSSSSIPKPLKGFDIPSQWAIMIVCWLVGAWMLIHIIKVMGQKFSWIADSKTLTVPGPITITPDQIEEVDRRKWDKFIVFLKLNSTHPTHAGKEIKVDTYQHALVEDWIVSMDPHPPEPVQVEAPAPGSQVDPE